MVFLARWWRLAQQLQRERFLQNDFRRGFGGEEAAGNSREGVVRPSRVRNAGDHGQVRLVLIAEFSNKADVGISFQHVGQALDLLACGFIQGAAFGGGSSTALFIVATEDARGAARSYDYGIEKP